MGRISDWFDKAYEILDITLLNKWLWIIIGSCVMIVILPFAIVGMLLLAPPWLSAIIAMLLIIGWGVAGGYKEYLLHKRKSEEERNTGKQFFPSTYEEYLEQQKHRP